MVTLADYPKIAAGKVRELYAVDDEHLLLVASDRISAFDHVLTTPIPDKGRVLTAMSVFWFEWLARTAGVDHHMVAADDGRIPADVRGRALLVRRLTMLQVEAVARGYLAGSAFSDYQRAGSVCGVPLPDGLTQSARLPEPIFTPASKAPIGEHDENIDFAAVQGKLGERDAERVREATLRIYSTAAEHAERRGMILADTKFEFGLDAEHNLVLGDEVLTPDSSRYWPADGYAPGKPQPAFDKQYVRDWLTSPASGWDRASDTPPPPLPDDVIRATRDRYVQAYELITGLSMDDWIR
ncbi:phosphoribosylaminoimidazole-succinocarboxamide synthase [Herbihabitans rhizosphaerae]|uniref:Phosphoribosylaminoimidazole-succinocarboxamide synthase n=1 Tax=Herbihabitans rhizosphaerae TaxID=1872711 RepID=A0A4Q7KXC9_9PSEU|nr:phosphoribosylaminoimidazolesuccinocarboxamide synthase [Herbihabitans rhizosphaerae]RZS41385.1 phosphoribosylaminoimidazole-succinocarboxamide synthase [Herbihabitans rhizosphaerae]